MSATKILWGQVLLVSAVVLGFVWAASEWTAWALGFQPQLGRPWFALMGWPVYPPLARQLRREGRVELHAIIAMDGSIQALEVVSGDPLFLQSALAAVREWRYRPTILDGQPVEVDTHVTVIYTLSP